MLAIPAIASAKLTWKRALLVQINTYRVHNHRASLHFNTRLATAAQAHSNNMARYRLFSHTSSNGVDWARRIRYYGYRGRYLGENLAVGQFTPSGTFNAWYYSSAHRANMLSLAVPEHRPRPDARLLQQPLGVLHHRGFRRVALERLH